MRNDESLQEDKKTESGTQPSTEELNMSEGARMLIERMKTHPEEFEENGRFRFMLSGVGTYRSKRDREALENAYDILIGEPKFTQEVFTMIFNQDHGIKFKAQGRYSLGWSDAHALYGQREDLREDLVRVGVGENGVNTVHTSSLAQRINGALSKMVSK